MHFLHSSSVCVLLPIDMFSDALVSNSILMVLLHTVSPIKNISIYRTNSIYRSALEQCVWVPVASQENMGKESRLRDRLIYADGMKTIPMKLPVEGPGDRDKPPHLTHTSRNTSASNGKYKNHRRHNTNTKAHKQIKESLKQSQINNEWDHDYKYNQFTRKMKRTCIRLWQTINRKRACTYLAPK